MAQDGWLFGGGLEILTYPGGNGLLNIRSGIYATCAVRIGSDGTDGGALGGGCVLEESACATLGPALTASWHERGVGSRASQVVRI